MNVISDPFKVDVPYVEVLVFQMPTIVGSAYSLRKTGMAALRLSTWEVLRLICGMKERNMDLSRLEINLKLCVTI